MPVVPAIEPCTDPVSLWLAGRAAPATLGAGVCMNVAGRPVEVHCSCPATLVPLQQMLHEQYPLTDPQIDCRIEVYRSVGEDRRIILPLGEGSAMADALPIRTPLAVRRSEGFLHCRWTGVESFWRPFDLLVSFVEPDTVRIVIGGAGPAAEKSTDDGKGRIRLAQGAAVTAASCDELASTVRVMVARVRGQFCLHAGAVARDGRCALIMGPSGSGKTTTCLTLLRGGFRLLSDELTFLDPREPDCPRIWGLASAPRLVGECPRTLDDLEATLGQERKGPKQQFALPPDATGARQARPGVLLFLRLGGGKAHGVEPLAPQQAFVATMGQVLDPTGVFRQDRLADALIGLANSCRAYRLTLGRDLRSLPALVQELLEQRA